MMKIRKSSRIGTNYCHFPTYRVIQLSTVNRTNYDVPSRRVLRRDQKIVYAFARTRRIVARSFAVALAIIMILFSPIGALAQESPTSSLPADSSNTIAHQTSPTDTATSDTSQQAQESTPKQPKSAPKQPSPPPKPSTAPPTSPKKPSIENTNEYSFNESTGSWENGEYAWNPTTGRTKPLSSPNYSYNPDTNAWDTTDWRFDSSQKKYVPNSISLSTQKNGNEIALDSNSSDFFSLYNNVNISNNINSIAQSGDAWVTNNTMAGNALSGNALTVANIFNMLNSSVGLTGGNEIATFSSDIYGDVVGDLYIDPSVLATLQPASGVANIEGGLDLTVTHNQKIENNVDLNSVSGDANITHNTSAGDAKSGSADAVANLVNMLNSTISSGSTFLGLLNIYGNLNGDILLPPGLLDSLIASNTHSDKVIGSQDTSVDISLNTNQSILNNINANATTGNASVTKNTIAGNATSGDAITNVTVFNLTGRNVIATNSLLVFVNVLGQWVGLIVNAPAGSTSAILGTSVTEDSYHESSLMANTNSEIKNNVNLNAASGDANVSDNTLAGNATSGDATASANIANLVNSNFSLSSWFGILFINVFGSWNGSFGVDTSAGNKPVNTNKVPPKVFQFIPTGDNSTVLASVNMNNPASAQAVVQAVEAAQDNLFAQRMGEETMANVRQAGATDSSNAHSSNSSSTRSPDLMLPLIGFVIGSSLLGGERLVSRRQRRK